MERNQGTTARWADPAQCEDYLDLQCQLNQAIIDQRENYRTRTCGGKTRAEQFPELFRNHRKFHFRDFDMKRAYEYLSKGSWQRKISSIGTANVFGATYQVGYPHRNKELTVLFEKDKIQWLFCDAQNGLVLKALPAKNLTERNILLLSYCQ